jgi:hypothetical protein
MKNPNITFTGSIPQTPRARLFRLVPAAAVTALVALIMQVSAASAQAFSVADLNGAYADQGSGFQSIFGQPGPPIGANDPVYGVGLWTFDGAGNFTASLVLDGLSFTISPNFSGTYSVNADGTGTINWVSMGIQRIRAFVIGDGGNQLKYVHTDPTVAQTFGGSMVKQ